MAFLIFTAMACPHILLLSWVTGDSWNRVLLQVLPKRVKEEEKEQSAKPPPEPQRKRTPKVTPIGIGGAVTNKLALPTLALSSKSYPDSKYVRSGPGNLLPPSKVTGVTAAANAKAESAAENAASASTQPAKNTDPPLVEADLKSQTSLGDGDTSVAVAKGKDQPQQQDFTERREQDQLVAKERMPQTGRKKLSKDPERGTANQRAQDRAHNEAVLASALGEQDAFTEGNSKARLANFSVKGCRVQWLPCIPSHFSNQLLGDKKSDHRGPEQGCN